MSNDFEVPPPVSGSFRGDPGVHPLARGRRSTAPLRGGYIPEDEVRDDHPQQGSLLAASVIIVLTVLAVTFLVAFWIASLR